MDHPIILFDGVCNFCNGAINFTIRQDKHAKLRFAPLQSAKGQGLLATYNIDSQAFNSFVLIDAGRALQKSSAALRVMRKLPWFWQWTQIFWLVPRFIRDGIYDLVARNRYKWFGRKEVCMIPSQDMRSRFLS